MKWQCMTFNKLTPYKATRPSAMIRPLFAITQQYQYGGASNQGCGIILSTKIIEHDAGIIDDINFNDLVTYVYTDLLTMP